MNRTRLHLAVLLSALFLFTAQAATAAPGAWRQVGKPGEWKATVAGVALGSQIYTVESSGSLYVTDPATGAWKAIGKKEFGNTRFIFAAGGTLYTLESSGSLYAVDPASGSWKQLGKPGEWKATLAGTVLDGKLYTTESGGGLYVTDLATGVWKAIGKKEFGNTRFMFAAGSMLYTIEASGSLYAVNPVNGSWKQLGKAGEWKATVAGSGLDNQLYTVESSGALYVTDPATGVWKALGKPEFRNTRFVFPINGKLYTIEASGSLYEVDVR